MLEPPPCWAERRHVAEMWRLCAPHGKSLGTDRVVPDLVEGDAVFALFEAVDAVDEGDRREHLGSLFFFIFQDRSRRRSVGRSS